MSEDTFPLQVRGHLGSSALFAYKLEGTFPYNFEGSFGPTGEKVDFDEIIMGNVREKIIWSRGK